MENQQKNELQKSKVIEFEKNISDSVTNRVNALSKDGRLNLPANYSVRERNYISVVNFAKYV